MEDVAVDPALKLRELMLRGHLKCLLRKDGQTRVWDFIHDFIRENPLNIGPLVVLCHRRLGKSVGMVYYLVKRCLTRPGEECRYGAPTVKQCNEIVRPIMRKLINTLPPEIRPRKLGGSDRWEFYNPRWPEGSEPSYFTLFSCKEEADDQRGKRTTALVIDEARDVKNLVYILTDVFAFTMVVGPEAASQGVEPIIIMISTPAKKKDSALRSRYQGPAERDGRLLKIRASENSDWTEKDERMLLRFVGSKDCPAWLREAECEDIDDDDSLILPEFSAMEDSIVVPEWKRPTHYYPYVFIDTGWVDYTAALFAYVDYQNQKLVIEDELFVKNTTTGDLARLIREKEERLFSQSLFPVQRVGDFTAQQLDDLRREHGLYVRPAEKWDRDAGRATCRTMIAQGRLVVLDRCKKLIHQCQNGFFDDKGDFARVSAEDDPDMGHCDGCAALIYGSRAANFKACPFPTNTHYAWDHFMSPGTELPVDPRAQKLVVTHNPIQITHNLIWQKPKKRS